MTQEPTIAACHYCGQKNRVPPKADHDRAVCGKCRSPVFGPKRYLVFDCETNGLPTRRSQPEIVQLAWSIYSSNGELLREHVHIIRPIGYTIPAAAARIHGITTETALARGEDKHDVLRAFIKSASTCRARFVAHNLAFDRGVVLAGIRSIGEQLKFGDFPSFCTMLATTELCGIPGRFGRPKWPTLQELHEFLFGASFEGAHDALADVRATSACFFHLKQNQLLPIDL